MWVSVAWVSFWAGWPSQNSPAKWPFQWILAAEIVNPKAAKPLDKSRYAK
jgi:hypothetical protein